MSELRVLCDAVPFCFGPISKMISVSKHLNDLGANLDLLAHGTSKELGEKAEIYNIVECNSEKLTDLKKYECFFENADVFVTVMNPVAAKFALEKNVPVVYIDSLFWMWDSVPKEFAGIDRYFVQNFFNSKSALNSYPFMKNVEFVGPIIDDSLQIEKKKEDFVLVNFGGMESALIQIGKNSNYPFVVGGLILDELERTGQKAFVCGNDKVLKKILKGRKPSNIIIGGRSHEEFLELLRRTKLLITTPGLTTTFEAFHYGAPVVFLPPENYSQFLNLKIFRQEGVAKHSFHWMDLEKGLDILPGEDEKLGVDKVLQCIKRFESNKTSQRKFKKFISGVLSQKKLSTKEQRKYIDSLGRCSSKNIAKYIYKKFSRRGKK